MSKPEMPDHTATLPSQETTPVTTFLGELQDYHLGSLTGIPAAPKTEVDHQQTAELLHSRLRLITDQAHIGCIDGRCVIRNSDGSQPEVRGRQVSGTGALLEILLNGNAAVIDSLSPGATIGDDINVVETQARRQLGWRRSAHEGGCAGVGGAIQDNQAVASNPAIMELVQAFMQISEVSDFTGLAFDSILAAKIKHNAAITAEYYQAKNWDGQAYVAGVKKDEPAGCEQLLTAPDEYHGHREQGIATLLSRDKSIDVDDFFVLGIQQSLDMAEAFSAQRGLEGKTQIFMANLAKHVATATRICGPDMPIHLVVD